jgi:hypothetical protein
LMVYSFADEHLIIQPSDLLRPASATLFHLVVCDSLTVIIVSSVLCSVCSILFFFPL